MSDQKQSNNKISQLYPKSWPLRERILRWRKEFHRTTGEEWANGISHLVGTIFGIVALVMLCVWAAHYGNATTVVCSVIFGTTLIILYNSSTIYHLVRGHRLKSVFQVLDHISIYLLIAGTYTPYSLLVLKGPQGWFVFGLVWGLTIVGILIETVFRKLRWLSLVIYLFMGWNIVFFFRILLDNISTPALIMLIAGGISYTFGVIFYLMDKVPYMHTIWHFFVLGGSVCHWISINFYVLPQ
jgi:hemolysin III